MKKITILATILMSMTAFAGGGSSVGPANPAAVNCYKLGGSSEGMTDVHGQYSNCVIEEWSLWTQMNERGLIPQPHPGSHVGMANPAAVNCVRIGGQLRFRQTPEGSDNDCVIEQWTLMQAINVTNE